MTYSRPPAGPSGLCLRHCEQGGLAALHGGVDLHWDGLRRKRGFSLAAPWVRRSGLQGIGQYSRSPRSTTAPPQILQEPSASVHRVPAFRCVPAHLLSIITEVVMITQGTRPSDYARRAPSDARATASIVGLGHGGRRGEFTILVRWRPNSSPHPPPSFVAHSVARNGSSSSAHEHNQATEASRQRRLARRRAGRPLTSSSLSPLSALANSTSETPARVRRASSTSKSPDSCRVESAGVF